MNETARPALPEALVEAAAERFAAPSRRRRLASVRVSPGNYLATSSALTFATLFFLHAGNELFALVSLALAWIATPLLAFTDRINFDGRTLSRKGVVPLALRLVCGRVLRLQIEDIERVETSAVRTLRRGGRVRYRYRSEIAGHGTEFVFSSGTAKSFRRMVRILFPLIANDKLDARSIELRDYLTDTVSLSASLRRLRLASSDVLDGATRDLDHHAKNKSARLRQRRAAGKASAPTVADIERGRLLRSVANELRVAGRLREAAEAFRRALLVMPDSGWLIYDFARFLRSQASALADAHLLSRSRAALRLAAQRVRSSDDADLLSRIGESFFEHGETRFAADAFRRAVEINPRAFRAQTGLAEIALRNGKLAHVIHHYNDAVRIAPDEALARYARREADYYARLNSDDDYLATELRRISWLQNAHRARKVAMRLTIAGVLLILVGTYLDESVEAAAWSLSTSSIIAWIAVAISGNFLARRRTARSAE